MASRHQILLGGGVFLGLLLLLAVTARLCSSPSLESVYPENLLVSEEVVERMITDLKSGKNVEVRELLAAPRDGKKTALSVKVDSLGQLLPAHQRRLERRWTKIVRDSHAELTNPKKEVDENSPYSPGQQILISEARHFYALERYRALLEELRAGSAFYTTASVMPRLKGWRFSVNFGFEVPFDVETGEMAALPDSRLPSELRDFSGRVKNGEVRMRQLNVAIPIQMSKYRAYQDAIEFERVAEREVANERATSFNSKPFHERERLYKQARDAVAQSRALTAMIRRRKRGSATSTERKKLLELYRASQLCPLKKFDKTTMRARIR